MKNTEIIGMPYFSGFAVGVLQRGFHGDMTNSIVLITQDEVAVPPNRPAGIIVIDAAPFSHAMIGLLGLGVPTVLISAAMAQQLDVGVQVLINGDNGLITRDLSLAQDLVEPEPQLAPGKPVCMADGSAVYLCASVRSAEVARHAVDVGAQSIGLVRSEFLLAGDQRIPDLDFYRRAFRQLCEAAAPLSVTVRLLDVAADKLPPWLPLSPAIGQPLGLQGVRLWHQEPVASVVAAQLEALAELAQALPLQVLIPYVVRLEELDYWLEQVHQRLPAEVPVGVMAETPASVLDIDKLLARADFVGVGCNDLMQGLFAADRDIPALAPYLDPYAPVLYRLLKQLGMQAGSRLVDIRLCGVLAQQQGVLPLLLGLGYRSFSVDAPFIPHLARIAASVSRAECAALAEQACMATTTREVLETLGLPTNRPAPFLGKC